MEPPPPERTPLGPPGHHPLFWVGIGVGIALGSLALGAIITWTWFLIRNAR